MKTELLAPAGSMEALKAAVSAGADAVYLGGAAFGARAYAKNLDEQEILSAIDYVHLRNRKLYLTVNTLLKEEELEEKLYPYLRPYYEQGLDAVIVQDMGVLKAVRSWFPDLDIHASTQMTVTGSAGARCVWYRPVSFRLRRSRKSTGRPTLKLNASSTGRSATAIRDSAFFPA